MAPSAVVGAETGLVAVPIRGESGSAAVAELVYGAVWLLGPLLIMPSLMGMRPQLGMALAPPMQMSLVDHLLYGPVTGLAYLGGRAGVRNA